MAHDLRFALRMIFARRWFSLAVIATLALGIGLNTMVFTIIYAALFKPVPVPHGERLVALAGRNLVDGDNHLRISLPDFRDFRAQTSSFEALEAATDDQGIISEHGNTAQAYQMEHATAGIFSMLQTQPILGRGFRPGDDAPNASPVLLLGYGIWKERYGSDPGIIGREVNVNEKPATIIGVMPKDFKFPTNTEMWMPLQSTPELEKRTNRSLQVFAMLKPGVGLLEASVETGNIAHRIAVQYPNDDKDIGVYVETFQQRYNGGNIRMIFLLMLAAVGFVLLIACANVANMMLSRAIGRQREMSIRAALGASRWRVIRQLLIESVVLSCLGGLAGFGLALAGVHWFDMQTQNVGKPYWVQFTMDYSVFGYFALLCLLSGLLFGIAPALRSSRADLNGVMKEGARSAGRQRGGRLSGVLVVLQLAMTLVLLTGAGVFVRSLVQALSANRSVPADQILSMRIDFPESLYKDTEPRQRFYDQLLPRISALPGVHNVAVVSDLPGLGSASRSYEVEHSQVDNPAHRPSASFVLASPGYFSAIDLPILSGRDFGERDGTADHKAAILTRDAAARLFPGQDPIGKRFRFYDDNNKPQDWITVIGISADLHQDLQEVNPKPLLFIPWRQEGWNGAALVVQSSGNSTAAVRSAIASLDSELPIREVSVLTQSVEHQQWYLHLFSKLFMGFALIALLIASVGIYAVIAQASSARTQEIGVRMALGASVRNIVLLVMTRGLWQLAAGLALGLAASFPAARLMAKLPIGVSASDPVIFTGVSLTLITVGLVACWLPARRAAALDPVKAIRYE